MGLIGFGWFQSLQNKTTKDYFLGNKKLPWVIAMFSIVATETSVLTFISIPGIAYRGDWFFLQLAFGYIFGRILVSIFLLPKYFSSKVISIYELLGKTFGKDIQKVASAIFLVTRLLADGIRFLATAVIIQVVTGWSLPISVLIIGIITLVYSILGGIRTIVWIDSFQFILYLVGGLVSIFFIVNSSDDSFSNMLNGLSNAGKINIFNFSGNILKDPYFFFSAFIGGIFLSFSSHGVDYMMVQRVLGTKDLYSGQKAMIGSGIFVTIQFLIFLLVGSLIFDFLNGIDLQKDREFSTFIVEYLPIGFRGLLLAGILSAAMSTLSSSINSLASSTIIDWFGGKPTLRISRLVSLFWAMALISIALVFDESDSAIVIIGLQIASFTYGGLLGLFLLTKLNRKFHSTSLVIGLISSLLIVFYLKYLGLAWTWFILVSVLVNILITLLIELFYKPNELKMIAFLVIIVSLIVVYTAIIEPYQEKKQNSDSKLLKGILNDLDQKFENVIQNPQKYKCQILYTQINRDEKNNPIFKTHSFNLQPDNYFYPASAIKLPIAALALDKVRIIEDIDRDTPLHILPGINGLKGVTKDITSKTGLPSIGHYIHKSFVVSDNDAFNRLYEFLGRDFINQKLWDLGYPQTRIFHRLSLYLSEDQNRYSNSIRFFKDSKILYDKPSELSRIPMESSVKENLIGDAHMENGIRIDNPMNFSNKNFMSLLDQHQFLIKLIFPEYFSSDQTISLSLDDYNFLLKEMSLLPRQSENPFYDHYDGYCKFFMYGDQKVEIPDHIKIFNKVGLAYGFLIDNAYIIDLDKKVEFFLTAVVYGNSNKVLNDNSYDYNNLTIPFFSNLGEIVYKYEIKREKKYEPDFTRFVNIGL